jgi:hypothetical protein
MKIIIPIFISILVFFIGCAGLDPNEANVPDGQDFQFATVEHTAPNIIVEVGFYDNFSGTSFFLYFDHDNDTIADFMVRCTASAFTVKKRSASSSIFTIDNSSGVPTVSGKLYHMEFPLTSLELSVPSTTHYWFFKMGQGGGTGGDREKGDVVTVKRGTL